MTDGGGPDPDNVGSYLISARSFEEYLAMFDLTEHELRGDILDCPGGGASFTARAAALDGVRALAVDPVYATPATDLARLVIDETERGTAHTAAGADRYLWHFFGDTNGHRSIRQRSASLFADDLLANPRRYVTAALPELPFADGSFDLVLCSHFLFTYADRLDLEFHRQALEELHRVSRGEVRIFPVLDQAGRSLDTLLDALRAGLQARGVASELRSVPYEFQRGGNQMLVLTAG
jgi:SAM-dependent methyltransferase